ncbi:hypothetical protein [Telluribacter sp.]|jgi:hypothetical protein|uniref:hypothetical protein n=1 Tax=Telluribacter sp. TaxID=1978767 RepID=UPI002E0D9FBF|nr:hypothetical protein [Telluribacter sp.]
MVKRYGKCTNIDDDCPKAKSGEIIKIEGANEFICPECKNDLFEVKPPPPNSKIPIILVAGLFLLGFISYTYGWPLVKSLFFTKQKGKHEQLGNSGDSSNNGGGRSKEPKPEVFPPNGVKIANTEDCQDCRSYYYVHDGKGGKRRVDGDYSTSCCQCGTVKRFSDGFDYSITCDGDRIIAKMITTP